MATKTLRPGEIVRDLFGERLVTRRPRRAARRRPPNAALPDVVRSQVDEIRRLLIAYWSAMAASSARANRPIRESLLFPGHQTDLLRKVALELSELLYPGDTPHDLHARLMLAQTISASGVVRGSREVQADNVSEMLPRTLNAFLDYSVASFFAKIDDDGRVALALEASGVRSVRDLVSRSEAEIQGVVGDEALVAIIGQRLTAACLGFAMRLPKAPAKAASA